MIDLFKEASLCACITATSSICFGIFADSLSDKDSIISFNYGSILGLAVGVAFVAANNDVSLRNSKLAASSLAHSFRRHLQNFIPK